MLLKYCMKVEKYGGMEIQIDSHKLHMSCKLAHIASNVLVLPFHFRFGFSSHHKTEDKSDAMHWL